jgi:hypothetical protein
MGKSKNSYDDFEYDDFEESHDEKLTDRRQARQKKDREREAAFDPRDVVEVPFSVGLFKRVKK